MKKIVSLLLVLSLAEIKAGMTAEEIQAIVDRTNAAPAQEDTTELLAKLTGVSVSTLPEETRE